MLESLGAASLTEFVLANNRRADVMALGARGEIAIIEVKSCLVDFQTDAKWRDYLPFCERFYFAVDEDFPADVIPADAGLIIADRFGAAIVRDPSVRPMSPARRKALTLGFARAAALRLHRAMLDSEALAPPSLPEPSAV
ncbi:MmcB family DNA repair protein [bacterium]|nr:MmcB family DNA repair protein [bacterium]